jgi:hypothetical protein
MIAFEAQPYVFRCMNDFQSAHQVKGRNLFVYVGAALLVLQALSVSLMDFAGHSDQLPGSAWVHLLGLAVGLSGTYKGSSPVRMLTMFLLGAGILQNGMIVFSVVTMPSVVGWVAAVMLSLAMVGSLVLLGVVATHKGFLQWHAVQRARWEGFVGKATSSPRESDGDTLTQAKEPLGDVKDELGIFEED